MKVFFLRVSLMLIFVILQLSFFDILFPWPQAPVLLLVAVVVWTLVLGFPRSLYLTVPLTLFLDSASYGAVSWVSLYAVLLAYGTSFLSRRLLIEHRGLSLALYAFFTAASIFAYQSLTPFVSRSSIGALVKDATSSPFPSWSIVFFTFLFSCFLFPLVYFILKRFENHIEFIAQKQFLNVR